MTEPTQPTSRTSPERPAPMREVATEWGLLYATCTRPDRVHFSTAPTSGGGSGEQSLLVNRIRYSCRIELTRRDAIRQWRSSHRRIDDTWYADSAWYRLLRYDRQVGATANARRVISDQLLPVLASWLYDAAGRDLLKRGTTYWQVECQRRANDAERRLSEAFQKVQDLRRAIAAGRTLTSDEERFLRNPSLEPDAP